MLTFALAAHEDLTALEEFLHENGANEWNYLPAEGVKCTFDLVRARQAEILCAFTPEYKSNSALCVGIGIYIVPAALPEEWKKFTNGQPTVFIVEVCVHRHHTGHGVGTQILAKIADRAMAGAGSGSAGAHMLLMDRHQDNAASAGMMRRVG